MTLLIACILIHGFDMAWGWYLAAVAVWGVGVWETHRPAAGTEVIIANQTKIHQGLIRVSEDVDEIKTHLAWK